MRATKNVDSLPKPKFWEGTNVPRAAYATYILGQNNAIIPPELPKLGILEKKKMKKLTIKQELKNAYEAITEKDNLIEILRDQLREQNTLLDRARNEGNSLIDKYNKLAGKINALRTLVNSND